MPLLPNAVVQWQGIFTRQKLLSLSPTHVKIAVSWGFLSGHAKKEMFWCKLHLIGNGIKSLACSVDNELDQTEGHGLKADDPIHIDPENVIEVL